MKFGIFLSAPAPRPWHEGDELRIYQQELELAVLADQTGFHSCWMSEHHFLEEYCHSSAPELQLAAIAARTKNLRLGHGIVDMQPQINHPVRVAERIAILDLISNGRVEFGNGKGSGRKEWDGFGVDPDTVTEVWDEAVRAVLAMWKTEEFSWDGKHIKIPGPRNVIPKPVQKPHPPLWMACTNPETAGEAGRRGVGALLFAFQGLADITQRCQLYRDGFAHPKDRFSDRLNDNIAWVIGGITGRDDRQAIETYLTHQKGFSALFARYWPSSVGGTLRVDTRMTEARPANLTGEALVAAGGAFAGDASRILDLAHRTQQAGVTHLILSLSPGMIPMRYLTETVNIWGERVIPAFAGGAPRPAGAPGRPPPRA